MSTTLLAVQVDLPAQDVAAATAAFAFMRAYGSIWGVAIPSASFNSRFAAEAYRITDERTRQQLNSGRAYRFVTASILGSLDSQSCNQVVGVFTQTLKTIWLVSIAFSGAALLLVFVEKEVVLRTDLQTEYGLKIPTKGGTSRRRQMARPVVLLLGKQAQY